MRQLLQPLLQSRHDKMASIMIMIGGNLCYLIGISRPEKSEWSFFSMKGIH